MIKANKEFVHGRHFKQTILYIMKKYLTKRIDNLINYLKVTILCVLSSKSALGRFS